jgi:hypothetical protein
MRLLCIALLFALSVPSHAEVVGQIVEYGYYRPMSEMTRERNYNTATGYVRSGGKAELVQQTEEIVAQKNRLFGFKFRMRGFKPDAVTADLTLKVSHPTIVRPNGTSVSGYSYPVTVDIVDGIVASQSGYRFDKEYEMVPGPWRFEYWHNNKMIVEKTFNVVLPEVPQESMPQTELSQQSQGMPGPLVAPQQDTQPAQAEVAAEDAARPGGDAAPNIAAPTNTAK